MHICVGATLHLSPQISWHLEESDDDHSMS